MAKSSLTRSQTTSFLIFISYLQILGCILVVMGHSFHEYPDGQNGTSLWVYRAMYSFRMPVFTFVSGFLMVFTMRLKDNPRTWRMFTTNKVKRLIIPFVVLNLVTFAPRALMSGLADNNVEISWSEFWGSFVLPDKLVVSQLWFIQMSFVLLVFCYALIRGSSWLHIKDRWLYLFCILLFVTLPLLPVYYPSTFSLDRAVELGIFFVLGMAYARYMTHVDRIIPFGSPWFLVLSAGVWFVLFTYTEKTDWYDFARLAGIAMCVSLCKILERTHFRILDPLIGSTYLIFLLSWFFYVGAQQVLHHFTNFPWWVYTVLSMTCGVLVPWLIYRYMERHPSSLLTRLSIHLLGQTYRRPSVR